ncbi:unnamed protein product [Phyllotreta striolata]|uniref:Translation initiation factor eIF2B subunit epsilon n=1 Tax=Phyllotreta striolata TaxID=444603 RepID=A0A9N9TH73_PHYSR|nr:unnamed protein product [Phyllotreta striolata]
MNKTNDLLSKEKVVQSVVIADTFTDEFIPISNDIPHALLSMLNKPLIDYTLEFLSLGGIEEVFLFCSNRSELIKQHIDKCIAKGEGWSLTMKVHIIVSESCQSFGDCLRDLDAKGLLRSDFVLLEPGVLSNVPLLTLLEKHRDIMKLDKYATMTIVLQESGVGHRGRGSEDLVLAADSQNRILFYNKSTKNRSKKIEFPLEMFLENPSLSILHNVRDTRIAICSASVLPLFSDNFDFQTKDDLIRGLLMDEEILEGTIYAHVLRGNQFGGAVASWGTYRSLSQELMQKWIHPLNQPRQKNRILKNNTVIGACSKVSNTAKLSSSVLGLNLLIGNNVIVEDSFVFSDVKLEDNVIIKRSIIGPGCIIKTDCTLTGCVLGQDTVLEKSTCIENGLLQSSTPDNESFEKLSNKAYKLLEDDDSNKSHRLFVSDDEEDDDEEGFSESEDELSYTQSPVPDDTKLFFTEVIDSLTRGFDDNLVCENLILEINSSRYAYNVTLKEVNFNVVRAILLISLREPIGVQYFSHLSRLLSYFAPVLKNYLRNESAMLDSLQAIEDVVSSGENIKEKWVIAVLQHMYNKDYLAEEVILDWFRNLENSGDLYKRVKPFADWLEEAEEASSDEDDDEGSD